MKIHIILILTVSLTLAACTGKSTTSPPPTNEPSLTPQSASVSRDISKEPIYTHPKYGYSFNLPSELIVQENSDGSLTILNKSGHPPIGPANFIYISVIPPEKITSIGEIYNYSADRINKLLALNIGESKVVADLGSGQEQWFTYTRVDDTQIDGHAVKRFQNTKPWEFPTGTTQTEYLFEINGTRYLLGAYTGGENLGNSSIDPRTSHAVISSFKLKK